LKLPIETKLIIFAVGVFATIVVRALTSERPLKNAPQQEPGGGEAERPRRDHEPNGPSADFAALIHTIAREGAANRAEGNAEDKGKKFRDWITILLLIATTGGVYWQIHEMIKVYEPIAEQAQAAKDNRVADHRAWIGVVSATADPIVETSPPTPIGTTNVYANTGRDPAQYFLARDCLHCRRLEEWEGG
jgi:hypothetical protein